MVCHPLFTVLQAEELSGLTVSAGYASKGIRFPLNTAKKRNHKENTCPRMVSFLFGTKIFQKEASEVHTVRSVNVYHGNDELTDTGVETQGSIHLLAELSTSWVELLKFLETQKMPGGGKDRGTVFVTIKLIFWPVVVVFIYVPPSCLSCNPI